MSFWSGFQAWFTLNFGCLDQHVHISWLMNQSFRKLQRVLSWKGVCEHGWRSRLELKEGTGRSFDGARSGASDPGTERLRFLHFVIKGNKIDLASLQLYHLVQQMGIESENYIHRFKTGIQSTLNNFQAFQQELLSSLDASCDLLIAPIFTNEALLQPQLDLDQCFVPAHETFTNKQLPHLCPLLNAPLLEDQQLPGRQQKLRFLSEYCVYLGLKRVAVKLNVKERHSILSSLENIAKSLRKGKIAVIVIVDAADELAWQSYIQLRRCLKQHGTLELCLEIGANLPNHKVLQRWMGEDIAYVLLQQDAFILNNKGYPVLPGAHETVVKGFMRKHTDFLLSHNNLSTAALKEPYFKYLAFLLKKLVQSMSKRDVNAQNLLDYLQSPLQPYIDNLQGEVYDIFEFDSPKYDDYQIALTAALTSFTQNRACICYYVGSGKGLILVKLMSACKKAGKKVKVYCIEKNPYPIQSLKRRIQKNKWGKYVEIVQADIKDYVMPEAPDLIFSELLGGLGDNELSPQCLRWAEKNATLKTMFVPERYTAYIRPISCHKLFKQLSKEERDSYYTVNFGLSYSPFSSTVLWSFQHPLDSDDSLERFARLEWKASQKLAIHGLQGSFDCDLFKGSSFTIVPEYNKLDFYSWFPIYFSFKQEELLEIGDKLTVQVQRKSNEAKVWYQWKYQIETASGDLRKESLWHNETAATAILLTEQ